MKNRSSKFISMTFWLIVLFYLDPGGFLTANLSPTERTLYNLITLVIAMAFWRISILTVKINIFNFKYIRYYSMIMLLWNLYYFMIYLGYNTNEKFPGVFLLLLRNVNMISQTLIVFPIVYFYFLDIDHFVELLIYSTIIIGTAFIITVLFNIPLVPTWEGYRRQVGYSKRVFMYGYGLINFVIPLFISNIFLYKKAKPKFYLSFLIALSLMFITIYRRDMISVLEHMLIISILTIYVQNKKLIMSVFKYINFKTIILIGSLFLIIILYKPQVLKTSESLFENTLIELGLSEKHVSSFRAKDVRLSFLGNIYILKAIKENIFFGTGYDKNWYLGDGGKKRWEGSDYIFLASFGMYGVVGLLIFLPFYILTYKVGFNFLKISRNNYKSIIKSKENRLFLILGIAAISEFIKNIFEYPNWFYPVGAVIDRGKYFIFFGLLLGSYYSLKMQYPTKKII